MAGNGWNPGLRESATFDRQTIAEIQRAATEGMYDIRGWLMTIPVSRWATETAVG